MKRASILLALALPLAACSADPTPSSSADPAPGAAKLLGSVGAGGSGGAAGAGGSAAVVDASSCGALLEAPAGTPSCGAGQACTDDADCAGYAGNYCAPERCAEAGCLRGACAPTKVMGASCVRAGECWSGECDCASGPECVCAPGDGGFGFHFP